MGLKIDLYCNDGSPLGITPEYIYGRGVGGAELAMMTWAETMARRGHLIRIYNNPDVPGVYNDVEYLAQSSFAPSENRDVYIVYRSPNPHLRAVKADLKIHWSTDQYTIGDFGRDIFPFVDKVICISPYHVEYHKARYGIEDSKISHIDLGVRLNDYLKEEKRIAGRCIYCSVPDRGLDVLLNCWPLLKEQRPDASLVITADYRLWGNPSPGNHQHRLQWLHQPDVIFLGKIPREQLIKEQLRAQVHTFPNTYEELFCISAAECQVAGALPVTSSIGAVQTTNEWGTIIEGMPGNGKWQNAFVDAVIETMDLDDFERGQKQRAAANRFDWEIICDEWERLIS